MAYIKAEKQAYETCAEIEIAVAKYFNYRKHLIVPNISWGLMNHECDLLILSKSGYATEVEIKISKSDLVADKKKQHKHESTMVKYLYFAIPSKMEKDIEHIPEHAGIIIVYNSGHCSVLRNPIQNLKCRAFSAEDRLQMARLGALRIWNLKDKVIKLKKQVKNGIK